ncbi:MAG: HAD hydrolase family protein [bacterium]|nr:HAD hydrolase family protein [bacterium]
MINLPKDIEYIITDNDGVLTDGFVYIPNKSGDYSKRLNFKDVMGIYLAINNGYPVGIISGESCGAIDYLQDYFSLEEVHTDVRNKKEVLLGIIERHNLNIDKIAYIGDDINDYEVLNMVGYPITVKNSIPKLKTIPNIQITENDGGFGAFREIIDALLD